MLRTKGEMESNTCNVNDARWQIMAMKSHMFFVSDQYTIVRECDCVVFLNLIPWTVTEDIACPVTGGTCIYVFVTIITLFV